jgi:hypothetical protein
MYATLWHFAGDPAELAPRYDAFMDAVGTDRVGLHACLVAPDGLVVVDTCPTREDWESVRASGWLRAELRAAGLPEPHIREHDVHAAIVDGRRVDR